MGHNKCMKSFTEHLWFETPRRRDYINITDTVAGLVRKSGVQEGLCLANAMHRLSWFNGAKNHQRVTASNQLLDLAPNPALRIGSKLACGGVNAKAASTRVFPAALPRAFSEA